MDFTEAPRRVAGALAFVRELQAFADECTATGSWDDELTVRRRQREEIGARVGIGGEVTEVKAL